MGYVYKDNAKSKDGFIVLLSSLNLKKELYFELKHWITWTIHKYITDFSSFLWKLYLEFDDLNPKIKAFKNFSRTNSLWKARETAAISDYGISLYITSKTVSTFWVAILALTPRKWSTYESADLLCNLVRNKLLIFISFIYYSLIYFLKILIPLTHFRYTTDTHQTVSQDNFLILGQWINHTVKLGT